MKLCHAPLLLPGVGTHGAGGGGERQGKGGKQKDQKYIAYLNTLLGAFHYIVVANLVKTIQNI